MRTFVSFSTSTIIACTSISESPGTSPTPTGDGYLRLFGMHVPALAAVFIIAAIVLLASDIVHRAGGRR